jgi:DNA-binding transcriptional regulator YhcF (GntR family)
VIHLNLDKAVGLSIYEQIKGQLLYAIYCGKIREGDRLPSIRELCDDLQVNYKTIRKVYLRLAQEEYVEIVKGSGVFLQKRSGENTYEQMRRKAVFKLLGEVSEKAKQLGVTPQKFAQLLDSFATGNNLRRLKLAVVDHEEEAFIFSRELGQRLKADVWGVPLDDVGGEASLDILVRSDYLLTTSWHLKEVRELAAPLGKSVLEIKPSHNIYREVLANARDRKVAIVIKDERTMHASWDVFMNIFYPSTEKEFWIAPIAREDLVEQIVREADLIYVSPLCWDEMRKRTPADRELKTYENFISEDTINRLKELQLLG